MVLVFGKGAAVTVVAVASRRAAAIVVFVDLFIVVVLVLVVALGRLDGIDSEVRAGRAFRLGLAGAANEKFITMQQRMTWEIQIDAKCDFYSLGPSPNFPVRCSVGRCSKNLIECPRTVMR